MPPKGYSQFVTHAASSYGFNAKVLDQVAFLENGRKAAGVNNWDSNAKAGRPSRGMVQFIPTTFEDFSKKAVAANPRAWKGVTRDINDWKAQLLTASWAMSNGLGSHWSTYERAKAVGGKTLSRTSKPFSGPAGGGPVPSVPQGGGVLQGLSFNAAQRGALSTVFKSSPFMQKLIAGIPTTGAEGGGLEYPGAARSRRRGRRIPDAAGGGAAPVGGKVPSKAPPKRKGEADWQYLQRLGGRFGLKNDAGDSQTTGGKHSVGSEHYSGRAIDFGTAKNSQAQLNAWIKWAKNAGFDALNEGDHIHVSMPGSGT